MSEKPNGGTAFPTMPIYSGDDEVVKASGGMSLRDYFAAHAPQHRVEFDGPDQLLEFLGTKNVSPGGLEGKARDAARVQAKLAYIYADAMIKERDHV